LGLALSQFASADVGSIIAPAESSGARVQRVITSTNIDFPTSSLIIEDGNSVVAAQTITGSAIQHISDVVLTEQGKFFIDRFGRACYLQRYSNNAS